MIRDFATTKPLKEIGLNQLLAEAIGAASTAWIPDPDEIAGGAVFDTVFASSILDVLEEYIKENYIPKPGPMM